MGYQMSRLRMAGCNERRAAGRAIWSRRRLRRGGRRLNCQRGTTLTDGPTSDEAADCKGELVAAQDAPARGCVSALWWRAAKWPVSWLRRLRKAGAAGLEAGCAVLKMRSDNQSPGCGTGDGLRRQKGGN